MRRPIIAVLLGFAGGILIEYFIGLKVMVIFACFAIIIFCILAWQIRESKVNILYPLILFAFSFFVGATLFFITQSQDTILTHYENEKVTITGRVISVQKKEEDYHKAIVKMRNGEKILVNFSGALVDADSGVIYKQEDLVGKIIKAKGKVEAPSPQRNPKTFDYALYLKTRGINALLKAEFKDFYISSKNVNMVTHTIAKLKYGFIDKLTEVISPDKSGILIGMLFGDKTLMDEDTYGAFQKNGIAHILSVSGIHVGIVYACINMAFGNKRRISFAIVTTIFLITYAALAEFSPSVVRAVTMILVHIFGKLTFQRYDLTCCTSACALVMLLYNPYLLFNVGFQLSYLAVFTLSIALPWTLRRIDFLREGRCPESLIKIFTYLSPLMVIQLGMAPFTAYCFNYFSLGAFILNIPIIFIAGLIIPLGIISILFSIAANIFANFLIEGNVFRTIIDTIFNFFAFCQGLLVGLMERLNEIFYVSDVSFFLVTSPSEGQLLFYYALMFFFLSEGFRVLYQRKKIKKIRNIIIIIIISSLLVPQLLFTDYSKEKLIFVDVGQGDCIHIKTPKGKNILIDGGGNIQYNVGEKTLFPYLLKNGVKEIDLAIVSHLDSDHYLGLAQLSQVMKVKKMAFYEAHKYNEDKIILETGLTKVNITYLAKGDIINVEDGISLEILYPERKSKEEHLKLLEGDYSENEISLVIKLIYEDLSVLLTGDIGFESEDTLIDMYRELDAEYESMLDGDKHKDELDREFNGENSKLQADILKVGHHGSKYSSSDEFIEAVNPKVAVFQVGKNNFGHPNEVVIEKFLNSGILIVRNDKDGALMFNYDDRIWNKLIGRKKEWNVRKMIEYSD